MPHTPKATKPLRQKNLRDPEATREALMQAGSELFAAQGFDGVPVEAIALRAGANKAMINYHFGGKRGLYKAIVLETFREIGTAVRSIAEGPGTPPEQIGAFVDFVLELGTTRRLAFPALFLREALSADAPDPDVLPVVGGVVQAITGLIAKGVASGDFRPMEPLLAYFTLISPMALFLATEPLRRRAYEQGLVPFAPPSSKDFAAHVKQTLLRGMGRADKERS